MSVSNRDNARNGAEKFLAAANKPAAAGKATLAALIGIGYSLLDVADAIREQTAKQAPLPDIEAVLMRVAAADGATDAAGHIAEHAAPEPA